MFNQEPPQGRIQRHHPMLNEPQDHIRCMMTGRSQTSSMRNGGNAAGKVRGCPSRAQLHKAACVAASPAVGGGKVSKIAAHCALSQGCKTALVALVTPWMRTAPERG